MPLDPKFTKFSTASPILISYGFTDIADGTGKVKFYLIQGASKMISDQVLYSPTIEEYRTTSSGEFILIATSDYDLQPFNTLRVVNGSAIYEVGCWQRSSSGAGRGRIIIKVVHYDGNDETILGTSTIFDINSGSTVSQVRTGTIPLTRKVFRKGDILRLKVEFWGNGTTGEKQIAMGTDPINRDGTKIIPSTQDNITKSSVYIPFEILE